MVQLCRDSPTLFRSLGGDGIIGHALYYVVSDDGRWKVRHSGADYPYLTRSTAIAAAIDAARTSRSSGHEAEVLIEGTPAAGALNGFTVATLILSQADLLMAAPPALYAP